jgi:hypothetical protein
MAGTNASIKALRALLRDNSIPTDDIGKHIRELSGQNDRLIAIIGGSLVEANLQRLLKAKMPNGHGALFDPNQALSTFSAKIDLSYALGLIDKNIKRNADYMRDIRNVFAHRIAPTSFRTDEIATVCRLLKLGKFEDRKDADTNMRKRFLYAVIVTGSSIAVKEFTPESLTPASLPEKRPAQ